jgi:hypothetical protein
MPLPLIVYAISPPASCLALRCRFLLRSSASRRYFTPLPLIFAVFDIIDSLRRLRAIAALLMLLFDADTPIVIIVSMMPFHLPSPHAMPFLRYFMPYAITRFAATR